MRGVHNTPGTPDGGARDTGCGSGGDSRNDTRHDENHVDHYTHGGHHTACYTHGDHHTARRSTHNTNGTPAAHNNWV